MGRILFRYLCREVTVPFLVGLCIFTLVLLAARMLKLVELVVNRGVPVHQMLELFLYVIPATFELTVPMALLLAILWGFGRLSLDRELTAIKSSGLSLAQIALPVFAVSSVVLGATFILTLHVRPWSATALRQVLYEITKVRATAGLQEKTFNDDFDGFVIYAEEIQPPGTYLRGIMIADSRDPQQKNTIFARSGIVLANEESQSLALRLQEGTIHTLSTPTSNYQKTHFAVYDLTLNLTAAMAATKKQSRDPQELSLRELFNSLQHSLTDLSRRNTELIELHRRFSLPFSCLVFSLLALPLSMRPAWSLRSYGFAMSLLIITTYYILLTLGETLAKKSVLPPFFALWLPNLVLGSIGIALFRASLREKGLSEVMKLDTRARLLRLPPRLLSVFRSS